MKRIHNRRRYRNAVAATCLQPLESREMLSMTQVAPLANISIPAGAPAVTVNLDNFFHESAPVTSYAFFHTTLGDIPVHLTPDTTPLTVANFLNYVNSGAYNNNLVHRSVPGFIWQAGGYDMSGNAVVTNAPVQNEFQAGVTSNVRGTVAMAKLGGDPNSATSQFFFNEADNASNLDNQNGGFTTFGSVVGSAGLAVMDAIANVPVPTGVLAPPFDQLPLQNYTPGAGVSESNLILINSITTDTEMFLVSSDAPSVVAASVSGNTLTVTPGSNGIAHITVQAFGSDGNATSETFAVAVGAGLSATATGTLPASVIAGQKAKLHELVALTSPVTLNSAATIALALSTSTTGTSSDIPLASITRNLKMKANKSLKLPLNAKAVGANVPAGTYHVLVTVTDATGSTATVDTGSTLTVAAPTIDLSGAFGNLSTTVKLGKKGKAQLLITNNGNVLAKGKLTLQLSLSTDQTLANGTVVATASPAIHILPGKTAKVTLAFPAGTAGSFYLLAQLDPANAFGDLNLSNNLVVTSAQITVA